MCGNSSGEVFETAKEMFPELSDCVLYDILWTLTIFPGGCPENIMVDIEYLKEHGIPECFIKEAEALCERIRS